MTEFVCPNCQAKVRKESTDGPGCPCCGTGQNEHRDGAHTKPGAVCCPVCNESTCTRHVLLG